MWQKMNEGPAPHPTPPPWQPSSLHPSSTAYTVASPPPSTSRRPWEVTLREPAVQGSRQVSPVKTPHSFLTPVGWDRQQPQLPQTHTTGQSSEQYARISAAGQNSPRSPVHASSSKQAAGGPWQHNPQPQHADKASATEDWAAPLTPGGLFQDAQPWQQYSFVALPDNSPASPSRAVQQARDVARVIRNGVSPGKQSMQQGPVSRAEEGNSPRLKPHYLSLPEAESYESFKTLAYAFRHWRRHAEEEQTSRYACHGCFSH